MSLKLKKKIETFFTGGALQKRFDRKLLKCTLEELLWPEQHLKGYDSVFKIRHERQVIVYPLFEPLRKLEYLNRKVDLMSRRVGRMIHPSVAYYHLTLFQNEMIPEGMTRMEFLRGKLRAVAKKSSPKSSSKKKSKKKVSVKTRKEPPSVTLYKGINKLKRRLDIDKNLRRTILKDKMISYLLTDYENMSIESATLKEACDSLTTELDLLRNPDYVPPDQQTRIRKLDEENLDLKLRITREEKRAETLENEVNRLADQLVQSVDRQQAHPASGTVREEMETLKREYSILSTKYDSLVTRNIDLANRLQKVDGSKTLEQVLDLVRDRINNALRTGVAGQKEGDQSLLKSIRGEIEQLQRARIYLGRALFDVGILYLRLEDKKRAIPEFKAARELGVEDPEINRILHSHS